MGGKKKGGKAKKAKEGDNDTKTGNTLMVIAIVIGFVAIFTAETLSDRRGPLQPRSKRAN